MRVLRILGRILKWGGLVVAGLVLLAVGVLLTFFPRSRAAEDLHAPSDAQAIERGGYLANHVYACAFCHTDVDESSPGPAARGPAYAGRAFTDFNLAGGLLVVALRGSNITSSRSAGIGAWTDGEIVRAMREGIARDGSLVFPSMPYGHYLEKMSKQDALDIVAYLRTVPPTESSLGASRIPFFFRWVARSAPKPVTAEPAPAPPRGTVEFGTWALDVAMCAGCHSSPEGKPFAGGNQLPIGGTTILGPNITPDPATGIGAYSDEDLYKVLDEGVGKDGHKLRLMPTAFYKGMSPEDKRAIIAALRKLEPVSRPARSQ